MPDKYDEAIAYLTDNPDQIQKAWNDPLYEKGGCLFLNAGKDIIPHFTPRLGCGCLTQIRSGFYEAETEDLTREIRNDIRIPKHGKDITVDHLPVFAGWRRRIDKELGRE